MKTIAIIMLIAGVILLAIGVAIFFLTDCRKVFRDLRTTKKMNTDSGLDAAAQEVYYSNILAYNTDEPPIAKKKGFKKNTPHEAVDDTALLAEAAEKKQQAKAPAFEPNKPVDAAEKRLQRIDRTKPLAFRPQTRQTLEEPQKTMPSSGTEPLRSSGQGTEPLKNTGKSGTQPLNGGTAPLKSSQTEPLKKTQSGTQPL